MTLKHVHFLFWNTYRSPLETRIARLVKSHEIDVVMLVEPGTEVEALLDALAPHGDYKRVSDPLSPIHVISKLSRTRFATRLNDARWQILSIDIAGRPQLLLSVAHLPSKVNGNDYDQLNASMELSADLKASEREMGHDRMILVGDLNMNPFELGVAMNLGLNATSTQTVAAWETRTVQRREYPLFYNPMWGAFGDRTPGPPGSYYRAAGQAVNYAWNVYDQVLLRPSVMAALEDVRLLDSDGEQSLLTENGLPDKTSGSDHLPLYFRLDLDKIRS
jgi:exonuclease III